MSQANRDGKKTARERVAAEKLRQQKAARRRRQITISGVVVAVIAIAGGVGLAVSLNKTKAAALTAPAGAVVDPITKSTENLGILVGSADAPVKMTVFEDFRCPVCKAAETAIEPTYKQYVSDGKVQITYHPVTLIDGNLGGTGSLYGGNAAACAQDANQFMNLHDLLYANQPDEKTDTYGSRANIIGLAGQIPSLKSNAAFLACVNGGTHEGWVQHNEQAFNAIGAKGTPTFYIAGKEFTLPSTTGMTSQDQVDKAWVDGLKAELDKQFTAAGGKAGTAYTFPAAVPVTTPSAGATTSGAAATTPAATPTAPSATATTTKS